MVITQSLSNKVGVLIIALAFFPFITPAIGLLMGISYVALFGQKFELSSYSSLILQLAVVLMGFHMNLNTVAALSGTALFITAGSVIFTLFAGFLLLRLFKVDRKTGVLIATGTAICGGSAIGAMAPVINARDQQISLALMVVFVLNGIALFIFPPIGHIFQMSSHHFGLWAAISIHDTSSVVGAAASYSNGALEVATTVKLTRALWIIPITMGVSFLRKGKAQGKTKRPWFILLFAGAMIFAWLIPQWSESYDHLNWLGNRLMVVALFLVGTGFSIDEIKRAGWRTMLMAIVLWCIISVLSFVFINML